MRRRTLSMLLRISRKLNFRRSAVSAAACLGNRVTCAWQRDKTECDMAETEAQQTPFAQDPSSTGMRAIPMDLDIGMVRSGAKRTVGHRTAAASWARRRSKRLFRRRGS